MSTARDRLLAGLRTYIRSIDEAPAGVRGRLLPTPQDADAAPPSLTAAPVVVPACSITTAGGGAATDPTPAPGITKAGGVSGTVPGVIRHHAQDATPPFAGEAADLSPEPTDVTPYTGGPCGLCDLTLRDRRLASSRAGTFPVGPESPSGGPRGE